MLGAKPVVYTTFREYDDENKILIRQSVEEGGCHIDGMIHYKFVALFEKKIYLPAPSSPLVFL